MRIAILKAALQQLVHHLLPKRWSDKGSKKVPPEIDECISIHFVMAWINYFGDRESYLLNVLSFLNLAEKSGNDDSQVIGLAALGSILDALSFFHIAERYHNRALSLAEAGHNFVALGHAQLISGMHSHYLGRWPQALNDYRASADSFQKAGDIRGWGSATSCRAWILNAQGDLSQNLSLANELCQLGRDSGDSQVLGWGLAHLGLLTAIFGNSHEETFKYFDESLAIFQSIPDAHTIAAIRVSMGQLWLRYGDIQKSTEILEDVCSLINHKQLRSFFVASSQASLAQTYLAAAELATPNDRNHLLRRASLAGKRGVKQINACREVAPFAYRSRGTYEWLRGKTTKARWLWQKSLNEANALGATYEAAKTRFEIGRHSGSISDLSEAKTVFIKIGAIQDLRLAEAVRS
jgi:tetratricopeptide (TPR) repeat protein